MAQDLRHGMARQDHVAEAAAAAAPVRNVERHALANVGDVEEVRARARDELEQLLAATAGPTVTLAFKRDELETALDESDALRVRSLLTAYGCCEVTDPIGELRDLDLLDLDHVHPEENPS